MCCKCCQYYLESIYWHCIEKHFCYDENIALYEEEEKKEEIKEENINYNNNLYNNYDNLAFYDNVSVIANRAIFCIEPIRDKAKPPIVIEQPKRKAKLHWWEAELENNAKNKSSDEDELDGEPIQIVAPKPQFIIPIITEDLDTTVMSNTSLNADATYGSSDFLNTIREENVSTSTANETQSCNTLNVFPPVKLRKKSLHERRVSKSLTLHIEKTEIPIIRQSSFPKFYLDTPEDNQADSSIMRGSTPILALETPVLPNGKFFDLRSVVQIENEKSINSLHTPTAHKETNRLSQHLKDKLKPLMKRNASSNSLHGT